MDSREAMSLAEESAPVLTEQAAPRCRCCSGDHVTPRGTKTGHFLKRPFTYHECRDCGFVFVTPVTDFSIYNDAYYAGRGPDPLVNYEQEYQQYSATDRVLEFENLFGIAQDHLQSREASQRVRWLDFGCGAGGLLKYLRDRGTFVLGGKKHGVDIAGHDIGTYADRLRSTDGFDILDWAGLMELPHNYFDVISCIEVLEHMPTPKPVIQLLSRLLKPGGLLLLTTGNFSCPLAKLQGVRFSYCIPEIHISLFNPELLATLYREAGLLPERVSYKGLIQFRILKTLRSHPILKWFSPLARVSFTVTAADYLYGTSAMPCAIKSGNSTPG